MSRNSITTSLFSSALFITSILALPGPPAPQPTKLANQPSCSAYTFISHGAVGINFYQNTYCSDQSIVSGLFTYANGHVGLKCTRFPFTSQPSNTIKVSGNCPNGQFVTGISCDTYECLKFNVYCTKFKDIFYSTSENPFSKTSNPGFPSDLNCSTDKDGVIHLATGLNMLNDGSMQLNCIKPDTSHDPSDCPVTMEDASVHSK